MVFSQMSFLQLFIIQIFQYFHTLFFQLRCICIPSKICISCKINKYVLFSLDQELTITAFHIALRYNNLYSQCKPDSFSVLINNRFRTVIVWRCHIRGCLPESKTVSSQFFIFSYLISLSSEISRWSFCSGAAWKWTASRGSAMLTNSSLL